MTTEDAIKWLDSLRQNIGQIRHSDLWPYEQAIEQIMELLEEQEQRIKELEEKFEALTRWRANAGAFD